MQLACPIAGKQSSDEVSDYAHRIAAELEREAPKLIVSRMAKQLRPGKVFIDWSQNSASKTTVTPYSLRAQPTPTVSAPLTWEEVESGEVVPAKLTAGVVLDRAEELGDLLSGLCDPGPRVP
jgi:bifunctional non-homologous end joining protein LigD